MRKAIMYSFGLAAFVSGLALTVIAPGGWSVAAKPTYTWRTSDGQGVVLTDGRVLLGGDSNGSLGRAVEIYDPATGVWEVAADMQHHRGETESVTRLTDGRVLAAGGCDPFYCGGLGNIRNSAEIYDPATEMWALVAPMNASRFNHAAVLLTDGRVLVVGGDNGDVVPIDPLVEIYDPVANTWTPTAPMITTRARMLATATLLNDDRVLVVGGANSAPSTEAEIYDPVTDAWTATGDLSVARIRHGAALLSDGRVLVVGGGSGAPESSELYDPSTGTWFPAASLIVGRVSGHSATVLSDGSVLVAGGINGANQALGSAEIYDPATDAWTSTSPMVAAREHHFAGLLNNGSVLTVGGRSEFGNIAELFSPVNTAPTITSSPVTTGLVRSSYSYQAAANGTSPINWSVVSGPSGLAIDAWSDLVSWTPQMEGAFAVTIRATNSFGADEQSYTITVNAAPEITSTPVTQAVVRILYTYQAAASGTAPIAWSVVTGPQGLTIDSATGLGRWKPKKSGWFSVTIRASNSFGSNDQSYTITVSN